MQPAETLVLGFQLCFFFLQYVMWELLVSFTGAGLLTFGQSWVCCFLLFTIYLHAKLTVSWVRIQWTDMTEASIFSSNKRANQPDTIPSTICSNTEKKVTAAWDIWGLLYTCNRRMHCTNRTEYIQTLRTVHITKKCCWQCHHPLDLQLLI